MQSLSIISCALFLASCSIFSGLSEIEYNNKVVELTNSASTFIEKTATLYNEKIPNKVTEQDQIDIEEMQTAYDEALEALEKVNDAVNFEGRNKEQETAIKNAVTTYLSAGEEYLNNYSTTLSYYADENYKKDITKVAVYDESLHTAYTTFIEANNDLVEALEGFVIEQK